MKRIPQEILQEVKLAIQNKSLVSNASKPKDDEQTFSSIVDFYLTDSVDKEYVVKVLSDIFPFYK